MAEGDRFPSGRIEGSMGRGDLEREAEKIELASRLEGVQPPSVERGAVGKELAASSFEKDVDGNDSMFIAILETRGEPYSWQASLC